MKPTMLLTWTVLVLSLVAATVVHAETRRSPHDDDHEMFYEDLRPYGEWIEVENGILVWRPAISYVDWQPYSAGRWVWTSHGWYWLSNEPFGWAVYHYGRWSMHPRFGWVWHPGRVWGPAWVEWRFSDAYIGWAPLPPVAVFHVAFGIRFTRHWVAPTRSWCFVSYSSFGSAIRRDRILPHDRVQRMIGTTRRGRSASMEREMIFNRGVDRDIVERRGGIRVDRYDVRADAHERSEGIREGRIETFRPDQDRTRDETLTRSLQRERRGFTAPRTTTPGDGSRRAFTRPQPDTRDVQAPRERSGIRDRKVAPNIRTRPEQTSPPRSSRAPGRTSGRKRDN